MSDCTSINDLNNYDLALAVMAKGLSSIVGSWNYQDSEEFKLLVGEPKILNKLLPMLESVPASTLYASEAKDKMNQDAWDNFFINHINDISIPEIKSFTGGSTWGQWSGVSLRCYFEGLDRLISIGHVDRSYESIFDDMKATSCGHHALRQVIPFISSRFFAESPEAAKSFMHSSSFKERDRHDRTAYYSAYIKSGLLDKKTARRIRSDSSSKTSCMAVRALLDNLELYKNQRELLTQFVDTRHADVQQVLASYAPDYMVPFMMSFDDYWAKKTLEQRAEAIAKKKHEKSQEKSGESA